MNKTIKKAYLYMNNFSNITAILSHINSFRGGMWMFASPAPHIFELKTLLEKYKFGSKH